MDIFRKTKIADSTGDAIPFYFHGTYHIFSLTPPQGTTIYPDRLRTSWSHSVSKNLVDWTELPTALWPGEGDEPDASGVWTGSVIHDGELFHAFYTGYHIQGKFQQTICHATSTDGVVWKKDSHNPVIIPKTDLYESQDWRDPYVFYNEEDHCYWALISARRNKGSVVRRGMIVLYRSRDLAGWEYYGPIYHPGNIHCPECSEMYKMGDNWYLSYSTFSGFVNTSYRVAKSPFGPWRTPKFDGIGGRRFYAAKSMENEEKRRFYFGWAHDRANRDDRGEWYWGGFFCVPHEVVPTPEGELQVKLPKEYEEKIIRPVKWAYEPIQGTHQGYGDKTLMLQSVGTTAYGFFHVEESSFLMKCRISPSDCRDSFGIVLKSDRNMASCLMLTFEVALQRVSLINLPMGVDPFWEESCGDIPDPKIPGPDGPRVCEKPFVFHSGDNISVKILIDRDMVEIFVGDKVAFTYRIYEKPEYEVGLIVQDGNALYYDISFTK